MDGGNTPTVSVPTRPAPVFDNNDALCYSTKKERKTPRLVPPPKPGTKSCPVPRLIDNSFRYQNDAAVAVSFSEDSHCFIANSKVYRPHLDDSYFKQCFEVEAKLGVGSFGEVFRVRSKEDGKIYACKRTLYRFRGEKDRIRKLAEVAKHQKLPRHTHCIEFFRAWEERQHLYILTEACEQSLATLADSKNGVVHEDTLWGFALDILQALGHLHKHSLVHMDIKPENIFLTADGFCKLGDFGLMFDTTKDNKNEVIEGDPRYLAGECLSSQFGPPADLFALGNSLLELALDLELPTCGPPWQALRRGELPEAAHKELSPAFCSLLKGLLHPDTSSRFTARDCLSMPVFVRLKRKRYCTALYKKTVHLVHSSLCVLTSRIYSLLSPLYNNAVVFTILHWVWAGASTASNMSLCTPSRVIPTSPNNTTPSESFPLIRDVDGSPTVLRRPNPGSAKMFVSRGPLKYSEEDDHGTNYSPQPQALPPHRPIPLLSTPSVSHSTPRTNWSQDSSGSSDGLTNGSAYPNGDDASSLHTSRIDINQSYCASNQSSHLSIMPDLSNSLERDEVNHSLYASSIVSPPPKHRTLHDLSTKFAIPPTPQSSRRNTSLSSSIQGRRLFAVQKPEEPVSLRRSERLRNASLQNGGLDTHQEEPVNSKLQDCPTKNLLDLFNSEFSDDE